MLQLFNIALLLFAALIAPPLLFDASHPIVTQSLNTPVEVSARDARPPIAPEQFSTLQLFKVIDDELCKRNAPPLLIALQFMIEQLFK
jgi:hypothetical protein